ncbi:pyridoxamine 5'-phosphate oxidase family protein [Knoellia subterranea]|uniref:Pyridoxamine 5'-phosphate oxidase n=1 Tax=Knoellia subterranea KCTC 19937 TaxID=1385521 RepID=A0A0A0JM21_9MICO|nr:pyridoxamine 5'-phosphate oxidase family protein [Knoellia subterranea]KGN37809.1 hypothetical protein N803_12175 [Knoellia subterranea KCTC 19937]
MGTPRAAGESAREQGTREYPTRELPAVDHSGLEVLDFDVALDRLRAVPIGRFAFVHSGEVLVLPVQHVVHGVDVCFRTAGDAKIEVARDHGRVAYEVDAFDPATRTGWSVLVQGTAEIVRDPDETRDLDDLAPAPWLGSLATEREWVRLRPHAITGREVAAPSGS